MKPSIPPAPLWFRDIWHEFRDGMHNVHLSPHPSFPAGKPRRRRVRTKLAAEPSERGTVAQAARILGVGNRKVQDMSAQGKIPGAAKMGRLWTYDLTRLRRFVEQQERAGVPQPCRLVVRRGDNALAVGTERHARYILRMA
jgi:excisionase family DNA binding protein